MESKQANKDRLGYAVLKSEEAAGTVAVEVKVLSMWEVSKQVSKQ